MWLTVVALILVATVVIWFRLRRFRELANRQVEYFASHAWNVISLQKLLDAPLPIPAPTGWAAASDVLCELARQVLLRQPRVVVEYGSGVSTLVMAAAIKKNGAGKLISLDHDPIYAQQTRDLLRENDLDQFAEVRDAPLRAGAGADPSVEWYSAGAMTDIPAVDLVFVDGPPGRRGVNVRGQVLPLLWPRLAPGGTIVFDDARRTEERAAVLDWAAKHPDADLQFLPHLKGTAIIRRRSRE